MVMSGIFRFILSAILITITCSYAINSHVNPKNGEILFRANCNSCHQIGRSIAAPDLSFVSERWKDEERLIQFTKNPSLYLTNYPNDDYVNRMMEHWLPMGGVMPAQSLSDNDVKDILAFIESSLDTVTKFWSVNVALNHLERLKSLVLDTDLEKQLFLKNIKSFKHIKQLEIANLSKVEFEQIKNNLNLEKLELRNTDLSTSEIQIDVLNSLVTLTLDKCNLNGFSLEFSDLKRLTIQNDNIETLDLVAPNLIRLNIENCTIGSLDGMLRNKTLKRLYVFSSSIIKLDLIKNKLPELIDLSILLSTVDQFEFDLTLAPNLKNIALENVDLSKEHWLNKLDRFNLENIYFRNNEIGKTLKIRDGKFPYLVDLSIIENKLGIFSIDLSSSPNLKFIDLTQNKLRDIAWISTASINSIEHLRLYDNEIAELPDGICGLDSLKTFSLENNQITEIPDCLFKMKSLKRAYFTGNQIRKINLSVENGKKFERISIRDNPIDTTGFYQLNIDIGGHPYYKKLDYDDM